MASTADFLASEDSAGFTRERLRATGDRRGRRSVAQATSGTGGGSVGDASVRFVGERKRCAPRLQGTFRQANCPAHRGDLCLVLHGAHRVLPGLLTCLTGSPPSSSS